MRSISKCVLVLGLAALLAAPALAQQRQRGQGGQGGQRQGRGGFGFGGGLGGLISNEAVQKEIHLQGDQVEKAREAVAQVREKHMDDFGQLRDLSPEERREKMTALNKTINDETVKALAGVLKPDQIKRLKEIELQNRPNGAAFTDPEVQKALKLTDDQKAKIKTITEDAMQAQRGLFQGGGGGGGDFAELQKKMATMRKETTDKIVGLLTADQKRTWKEMTGAPFEVQFTGGRGRRGGN